MDTLPPFEFRCTCGLLLFKGVPVVTGIEMKCRRCRELVPVEMGIERTHATQYSFVVDTDRNIITISNTLSQILGYTHEDVQAMTYLDFLSSAEKLHSQLVWEKALHLASETPITFDGVHQSKNGDDIVIRIRTEDLANKQHRLTLVLCEVRPVEESVEDKSPYTVSAHTHVLEVNHSGVVTYVSDGCQNLFQQDIAELLGQQVSALVDDTDDEESSYHTAFTHMADTRSAFSAHKVPLALADSGEDDGTRVTLHHTPRYSNVGAFDGYSIVAQPA